jgi:hypothetical protein
MAWLCVALALTTFAFGDITYDVETEFLHQVNPFPSVADIFYLATVPLLVLGLIMMARARRAGRATPGQRSTRSSSRLGVPSCRGCF